MKYLETITSVIRTIVAISIFMILLLSMNGCREGPEELDSVDLLQIDTRWSFDGLVWSPDGFSIASQVNHTDSDSDGIYIIDLKTGEFQPIEDYDDRYRIEASGPHWSQDSKYLVLHYPSHNYPLEKDYEPPNDIVVVDANSGKIVREVWDGGQAAWGPGSNELVIMDKNLRGEDTEVPVYLFNLETDQAMKITSLNSVTERVYDGFEVSPDGVFTYVIRNGLRFIDIHTGILVGEISTEAKIFSPSWSPDGKMLAYIELVPVGGGPPKKWQYPIRLLSVSDDCIGKTIDIGYPITSIDWSPDGQQLAFSTGDRGKIYFLDLQVAEIEGLVKPYQRICDHIQVRAQS